MKIGTKSLLFGVHQIFLHPLFVLWGWKKLYGWPNWRELVCIIIHDWGYWGCADMDGKEGERHPVWAALWAGGNLNGWYGVEPRRDALKKGFLKQNNYYNELCLFHSRFLAKKLNIVPSKLCWADKLGSALYPPWLWVLLGTLTGEIKEYMESPKHKETIQETNPFKYFKVYREKVVPALLKEHGVIK